MKHVNAQELYAFLNPKLEFENWSKAISRKNWLISDRGILLIDLVSATEIMEDYRRGDLV